MSERNKNGQFGKGNKAAVGNKGNGSWEWRDRIRDAAKHSLTPAKTKKVLNALYNAACDGDVKAMKEFLSRALGKEKVVVDVENSEPINFTFTPAGKKDLEQMIEDDKEVEQKDKE